MTVGQIMKGIMIKARSDPPQAAAFLRWLDELCFVYSGGILPIDDAVATAWGLLMAGPTRPAADCLIAATARASKKVVAIRNVKEFADMGVGLIATWAVAG